MHRLRLASNVITERVGEKGNVIGAVRLSFHLPSVSTLSFRMCMDHDHIARLGLKVEVIGDSQSQNAVGAISSLEILVAGVVATSVSAWKKLSITDTMLVGV